MRKIRNSVADALELPLFCIKPPILSRIILCMHPANDRRRYFATSSPIGWAHYQIEPCCHLPSLTQNTELKASGKLEPTASRVIPITVTDAPRVSPVARKQSKLLSSYASWSSTLYKAHSVTHAFYSPWCYHTGLWYIEGLWYAVCWFKDTKEKQCYLLMISPCEGEHPDEHIRGQCCMLYSLRTMVVRNQMKEVTAICNTHLWRWSSRRAHKRSVIYSPMTVIIQTSTYEIRNILTYDGDHPDELIRGQWSTHL